MTGKYRPEIARLNSSYKNNPTLFSFPENKTGHSILFVFKEYDYRGYVKSENSPAYYSQRTRNIGRGVGARTNAIATTINNGGSIELPFPKQLSDNTSLRINAFEREAITEAITQQLTNRAGPFSGASGLGEMAVGSIANIAGSLADDFAKLGSSFAANGGENGTVMSSITGTLEKALKVDANQAALAAGYLLRKVVSNLSGDISRTIDMVTGGVTNPKEALAFEGVDLKSHSFSWELYPSNRQETETIDKIVKLFKRSSLPDTSDLIKGVMEQTLLTYPSTVEIKLVGVNPELFPRYKPCMIRSVNVSYENAAGTVPIMSGGAPGSITLSVELQEMQAHTRADVSQVVGPSTVGTEG
jgi:hypothetical protein